MTEPRSSFHQKSNSIAYVYYGGGQPVQGSLKSSYQTNPAQQYTARNLDYGKVENNYSRNVNQNAINYQGNSYQNPFYDVSINYQPNSNFQNEKLPVYTNTNYIRNYSDQNLQPNSFNPPYNTNNYQFNQFNGHQEYIQPRNQEVIRNNGYIYYSKQPNMNQPQNYSNQPKIIFNQVQATNSYNVTPCKGQNQYTINIPDYKPKPFNNLTNVFNNQNTDYEYNYAGRKKETKNITFIHDLELPLHETKYFGQPPEEDLASSTVIQKISSQDAKTSFTNSNQELETNRILTFSDDIHPKCDFVNYTNGYVYEGETFKGMKEGFGILSLRDGTKIYSGEWKNDQFHGQGILNNISSKQLCSSFNFSDMNPVFDYWRSYEGEFEDGKMNGIGFLFLSNDEKFNGKFVKGVIEGEGSFYKRDGKVVLGVWSGNELYRVL